MLRIYTIFDKVAQTYHRPFFDRTDESCLRNLRQEVNRAAADNPLYQYPKDHAVFHVGTFDEETGEVSSLGQPSKLFECEALVNTPQSP